MQDAEPTATFFFWTRPCTKVSSEECHDPWFPADSVTWHAGSRHKYVTQAKLAVIRAVHGGKPAIEAIGPLFIKWISDARMLYEAWHLRRRRGARPLARTADRYDDFDDAKSGSFCVPSARRSVKAPTVSARRGWYRFPERPL